MIHYSKTAADTYKRIRDLTWLNARLFVISGFIALPVGLYYLLIGMVGSIPNAVRIGGQMATLAAVCFAIYFIVLNKTKKAVTANFDEYEIDGKIDFTIEKIDEDTLEFTRVSSEESFQISREDVKSIKKLKHINVILLKDKRTIDLPKQADIDEMIAILR